MARPRTELHEQLQTIVGKSNKVYFQPPSDIIMSYPCVVYERARESADFAGNKPYTHTAQYKVTVIDRNPDSPIPGVIRKLPMCTHSAFFVTDNLNHDVFYIYF